MTRLATLEDLDAILTIYERARVYMYDNGNLNQWNKNYPSIELLKSDIEKKQLYVILFEDEICAVFVLALGIDPTYLRIEDGNWNHDYDYGVIHRIASNGKLKGVFELCLDFSKNQCNYIRIDTHPDNKTMQHLILKNKFKRCGIIYVADGTKRIAFDNLFVNLGGKP